MLKKFLASILICFFLVLPLKTAFAFEEKQEVPASQETQDPVEAAISVYYFQDQYGGVLAIAPITEDVFLWVYISFPDSLETAEIDNSIPTTPEVSQNLPAGVGHVFYTGYTYDAETGLNYAGARYYEAKIGRFVSQDPAFLAVTFDLTDPQSLNSYAYARNNPLRYIDPNGAAYMEALTGFVVGFGQGIYGAGAGMVNSALHPIETVKNTGALYSAGISAGGELYSSFASNSGQAFADIKTGYGIAFEEFSALSFYDQGKYMGNGTAQVEVMAVAAKVAATRSSPSQVLVNKAAGDAFEKQALGSLQKTNNSFVGQVTLKTNSGIKTRVDIIGRNAQGICLVECKSSATAPLTQNQKLAFPEIAKFGATVVGQGKSGFPGGTIIPPTNVNIIRP